MITNRDRRIILHLEKYKYATIEHLEKIFFRKPKNSYNIARKRMIEIRKAGYVRVVKNEEINRLVYIYAKENIKPPDKHRLLVLDVLANLHKQNFNVQEFVIEKEWLGGKIKSDAFAVFTLENVMNRYQYFVEVHLSNNRLNLDKYDYLFESGEVQKYLGRDIFPRILLITDRNFEYNYKSSKVVKLNTRLDNFATIILP